MSMRPQELHPSLVHYPIALLPIAVGADLIGRATGSHTLREIGRLGMALTAGSAAVAALAGLAAQEEVNVEEGSEAHDMLATHRTLNIGAVIAATTMAAWRWKEAEASPAYLAAGLAAIGTVGYSAYLGGKMVYKHGLGVEAADGLYEGAHPVPEITRENIGRVARDVGRDVVEGARSTVEHMREGHVVPMADRGFRETEAPQQARDRSGSSPRGEDEPRAGS